MTHAQPAHRRSLATFALSFLTLILLAGAPSVLKAQVEENEATLKGTVLDGESGEPFEAVQVEVVRAESGERVAGGSTDLRGRFSFSRLEPGSYRVMASFIGYSREESAVVEIASDGEVVEMDPITLRVQAIQVEGIEVEAERPDVSFEVDRTVYRVDGLPAVGGGAATDALANVPELDVDIDGSVSFEGNTPEIYLNGRPAPMDGDALTAFLEQFPADMIDRVEVIPNPSARYDAEGSGGIVNIVLREGVELGITGNVFANMGTRGDLGSGARVNMMRDARSLQVGGFLRQSRRETVSTRFQENLLADPVDFLERERFTERDNLTAGMDVSAEAELREGLRVWGTARVNDEGRDNEASTLDRRLNAGRDLTFQSERLSSTDRDRTTLDGRMGVTREMESDRGDHEWSAEARWNRRSDDRFTLTETLALEEALLDADPYLARGIQDELDEARSRLTLRTDYTRPVGQETIIEMGLRSQLRDRDSNQLRRLFTGEDVDEREDTGYTYTRSFHSGYLTFSRSFGDLGTQIGVRAERTDTRFELPTGERFDNDYMNVFPTVNLNWRFDGGRQVRVSYSQRIRRPWPGRLNPIDRSDDPLVRQVGNPDLEPQYTHHARLEGRWRGGLGTLSFTPFLRYTTNEWAEIRRVDAAGVATETWENLTSTRQYGASLSASLREVAGIRGRVRLSGRREVRDSGPLDLAFPSSSFRWSVRGNASSQITSSLGAQMRVTYNPAREVPQGRRSSTIMTQVGVRQRFMDRRASLNVMIRDPFDLYDSTFESRDPSFVQLAGTNESRRAAVISFSYNLGSPGRR
ncbi:MAG: TonB-dependent receptor [Gemmatimonadales bacterium]|nr:MAG: TonB-dependent receptor [Gemmatimonadales bacterium]